MGYNRYQLGGKTVDFIEVLERLDRGWGPSPKEAVQVSRTLWRPPIHNPRATYLSSREILPDSFVKKIEKNESSELINVIIRS